MKLKFVYLVLLLIFVCHVDAVLLQKEVVPGITHANRVQLSYIKNETDEQEFQLFPISESSVGTVLPMTTFHIPESLHRGVDVTAFGPLVVKCSKGSFLPVFIQQSGNASGVVQEGYDGPYCLSMWMHYPHVSSSQKTQIAYAIKSGQVGKIGLQIDAKGSYRLIADQDIVFL